MYDANSAVFSRAMAVTRRMSSSTMQIKLKQGFGRAIRTESDTCVVAVLDSRATRGHRYFEAMREALPDMPVTSSLRETSRFYRAKKNTAYFGGTSHETL